jgi:hypothetical protein
MKKKRERVLLSGLAQICLLEFLARRWSDHRLRREYPVWASAWNEKHGSGPDEYRVTIDDLVVEVVLMSTVEGDEFVGRLHRLGLHTYRHERAQEGA